MITTDALANILSNPHVVDKKAESKKMEQLCQDHTMNDPDSQLLVQSGSTVMPPP